MSVITMYRGDKVPVYAILKDKNTKQPIDITGYVFTMTGNTELNPTTTDNEIFSISGVIEDAAAGKVSFLVDLTAINNVKTIHYDITFTNGDTKRTIIKSQINVQMDISK